jgi:SAM-dependent methyltransferase
VAANTVADRPRLDDLVLMSEISWSALSVLADLLRQAEFTEDSAAGSVGVQGPERLLSAPARYAFVADWPLGGSSPQPADVLSSLFILNRTVDREYARRVLNPELTNLLLELSFMDSVADGYQGTVSITPYRSRFFLSDRIFDNSMPLRVNPVQRPDSVMPPHMTSLIALDTIDKLDGAVMDVGCGSGFLALNMAQHCERTAGIDLNPRCIRFARANGMLNGSPAEFSVTDFADLSVPPGERYDYLIFNSPTSPRLGDTDSEFGQITAPQVLRTTAAVAPRVLRPGGTAYVLAVVEIPERLSGASDAVRHWLGDLDAFDVSVAPLDIPQLTITRRQLETRRLHGQSILVHSSAQASQLLDALAARGVGSVQAAMIGIRLP